MDNPDVLLEYQDNVEPRVGLPGDENGMTVVMTEETRYEEDYKFIVFLSGAAVVGNPKAIVTAMHCISGGRQLLTGSPEGKVKVWVIPTRKFHALSPSLKKDIAHLKSLGAVPAKAFKTLVKKKKWAETENMTWWGIDCALVLLEWALELPSEPPSVSMLRIVDLQDLISRLRSEAMVESEVVLGIEGLADFYSEGTRLGLDRAMAVKWTEAVPGTWMATDNRRVLAPKFGGALADAVEVHNGRVELDDMWLSAGFSGGGAYVTIPPNPDIILWGIAVGVYCNEGVLGPTSPRGTYVKLLTTADVYNTEVYGDRHLFSESA